MFKPKRAGDSIAYQHQDWNAAMRAARAHRDSVLTGGTDSQRPSWARYGILPMRNAGPVPRERFDILGIGGVAFEPDPDDEVFENGPVLRGLPPRIPQHLGGKFVVFQEPVAERLGIAPALLVGITVARVDVLSAADGYADITHREPGYFTSGAAGAVRILWKPAGTGLKTCLVRIG